jgi:transglutaminase-like putative cysteine protease
LSRQKNSSNYFDDLDMWEDTPRSQKQDTFKEPPKKAPDDLENFFDSYGEPSGQGRRSSAGRRSGRSGRKNPLPIILATTAIALCAAAAVLVLTFTGGRKPEAPVSAVPVVTQPAVQQPVNPVSTVPTVAPAKPAPVPLQEYRYFGKKLNAQQKQLYDLIRDGISRHADSIGPFQVSSLDEINLVVQSISHDYAEYFWFQGAYETLYYDHDTYLECTLTPNYVFDAQEYVACKAVVEAAAQPILDQLAGKSDYEKVKGVYEYLIDNTAYDLKYMGTTIYEMFHDRRGVCEGYARASQYLLTKLGVETLLCSGMSGDPGEPRNQWESHAWNIVKIDGVYYGLDTTWGDPLNENGVQTKNFWYLNLTDEEMNRQHDREKWSSYPICNDIRYNYYVCEERYLESFDKETVKRWFQEDYAKGEQLEFKCASESIYRQVYSWLVDNGGIDEVFRTVIPQNEGYQCSYGYSDILYVFSLSEN